MENKRKGGQAAIGEMYSVAGHLVPNPREVEIIARATLLRKARVSLREIAEDLNATGYRNRRNNEFTPYNVWWLFNRKAQINV